MRRRTWIGLATGTLVSAASMAQPVTDAGQEWVQHRSASGFTVGHPRGWSVATPHGAFIRVRSPAGDTFALIQPFFAPITARRCVEAVPDVHAAQFPQAHLQRIAQRRQKPDEVVASLTYAGKSDAGQAALLCSVDGSSGMLFGVAASQRTYSQQKPALIRILQSFRVSQPSAQAASGSANLSYIRWQDPNEAAFSLEVPRGWKASGGLIRAGAVDTRPHVRVVSPDETILVAAGDKDIPPFAMPNQQMSMAGFGEGQWYSPGYGQMFLVLRYLPGASFAKWYATKAYGQECSDLKFVDSRDRPDLSRAYNALARQYSLISTRADMGETAFTCRIGGRAVSGYYFAGTLVNETMPSVGTWHILNLYGYLATTAKAPLANAILQRAAASFRVNPVWAQRQGETALAVSNIVKQTGDDISRIIHDSYWNRQRVYDDVYRKWSNMTLGLTDVKDEHGQTWKVASGHNYYWRRGGTIAGTQTYDRPDIDFTPLQES